MTEADCEREKEQVEKEHEEAWSSLVKLETEMVTLREIHTAMCKVRISLRSNRTS